MRAKVAALFRTHAWTVARAAAFASFLVPLAWLWLASLPRFEGEPQGPGAALVIAGAFVAVALSLVADRLLAKKSGLRGRPLAVTVAQTAAVWAVPVGIAVFISNPQLAALVITTSYTPAAALALVVIFAGVLLFGPAQALELWALAATMLVLWMFPSLYGMADSAGSAEPSVAVNIMTVLYLPLALGSTAGLAVYLRRIAAARSVRGTLSRAVFAAGVVVLAIMVSAFSIWWINTSLVPLVNAKPSPSPVASVVASDLMSKFSVGELTTQTPAVTQQLTGYLESAGVGFTIVDWRARKVIVAVRRSQKPDSPSGFSYGPAVLTDQEANKIVSWAAATDDPSAPGFGSAGQEFESAQFLPQTDFPLALVVTQADENWMLYGSPTSVGGWTWQAVDSILPWLLSFLLIPISYTLIVLDRADRSRAELLFAQERARLSRDAHDRVYNRLTALAGKLETSTSTGDGASEPADEIRGTVRDLQRILGDVDARVAGARDVGAGLFDDLVADQSRRWGMRVSLTGQEAVAGLDARLAWELQCVVEEALTNAGRHGHAARATVAASRAGSTLAIEVADDGSGIAAPLGPDGLPGNASGLRGMADRVRTLGGTMVLASSPTGTTVTVEVPV